MAGESERQAPAAAASSGSSRPSSSGSRANGTQAAAEERWQVGSIPGVGPDDPLQRGVELAMHAVWLFLDSDFEQVEQLLHKKRHKLLYASEGYAAIQYLRAMMAFTREAMGSAQQAAESTVNLAAHYRKPRGVSSMLSGASSRASSPSPKHTDGTESDPDGTSRRHKHGEGRGWLRMDSPRLLLREKKRAAGDDVSVASNGSGAEMEPGLAEAKHSEQPDSDEELDGKRERSWASGLATVADSVVGVVRAGTQAMGLGKPEWHGLRAMTAAQRHAELVHAEAYLLRAMLNVAAGDGMLALLKEGWHVRTAYATYRACYAFVADAHERGEVLDDHFVSGTYLGMGVFNLVLSMLPAKLLRVVELVGFSADRQLGLELLAVAAGWRADARTARLLGAAPERCRDVHPCGRGLRSDFCELVLLGYHVVLCNDLFLGHANLPLAEAVLQRAQRQHPRGLLFMYFSGRLLVARTQMRGAIGRFEALVQAGRGSHGLDQAEGLIRQLAEHVGGDQDSAASDSDSEDWRQLQYLGHWERALCLMALGRWLDAAEGFNVLRMENNWNKAVYTYALASCMWEHYLTLCGGVAPATLSRLTDEQRRVLDIVRALMALVPGLKRRVAGKSIPVEKYVIRKANKFAEQEAFLLRPGLELLHVWNLYGKMPRERLLVLRDEVDRELAHMAHYTPISRAASNPYRHVYYNDDVALMLLTKGVVLRELAYPTSGCAEPMPDLAPVAADSLLRLLRMMPLVQRDHYLLVLARFAVGGLYLAAHSDAKWAEMALAQWKCVLAGKPLSSPPFLSLGEYHEHIKQVSHLLDRDPSADAQSGDLLAAPGCLCEERILQDSAHSSLRFYDGTWQLSDWRYLPADWADSRKYSLQNMIELRVFNATNRIQDR
ncbi:hypothetical protein IWW40_003172 [Coemansia sp. RSA 1250]|nr:hypothetical protein IWW40_003172 [Coemansia sp. RSA 1250]